MKGAAVHSLQVAWLTAVSFGTCAGTLPSSTPTRWAAAADTDESQASRVAQLGRWRIPPGFPLILTQSDRFAFSLRIYFIGKTDGKAARRFRNKTVYTSLLCGWFFSLCGTKVCQFSVSVNSMGVLKRLTAFYLHLHLNQELFVFIHLFSMSN